MKFKDMIPKLEEYKKLSDDLTARLSFEPPPPIPCICRECGKHYNDFHIAWDEIEKEIYKFNRGEHEWIIEGICPKCQPEEKDEDD